MIRMFKSASQKLLNRVTVSFASITALGLLASGCATKMPNGYASNPVQGNGTNPQVVLQNAQTLTPMLGYVPDPSGTNLVPFVSSQTTVNKVHGTNVVTTLLTTNMVPGQLQIVGNSVKSGNDMSIVLYGNSSTIVSVLHTADAKSANLNNWLERAEIADHATHAVKNLLTSYADIQIAGSVNKMANAQQTTANAYAKGVNSGDFKSTVNENVNSFNSVSGQSQVGNNGVAGSNPNGGSVVGNGGNTGSGSGNSGSGTSSGSFGDSTGGANSLNTPGTGSTGTINNNSQAPVVPNHTGAMIEIKVPDELMKNLPQGSRLKTILVPNFA